MEKKKITCSNPRQGNEKDIIKGGPVGGPEYRKKIKKGKGNVTWVGYQKDLTWASSAPETTFQKKKGLKGGDKGW